MLKYDARFIEAVEEGRASARRGDLSRYFDGDEINLTSERTVRDLNKLIQVCLDGSSATGQRPEA